MRLLMDEGEIIREYRAAMDPRKQIVILADQNCTTTKEIAQFLLDHGEKVDRRLLSTGVRKKKPAPEVNPELTEEQKAKFEKILDSVDAGEPLPSKKEEPEPMPEEFDQTAKADAGKPRLSLVPMQIMFDVAQIREYGNKKYPEGGPDNWKRVEPDRFVDALLRHLLRFVQDRNSIDEESGFSHLSHAACNLAFLCEIYHGGK